MSMSNPNRLTFLQQTKDILDRINHLTEEFPPNDQANYDLWRMYRRLEQASNEHIRDEMTKSLTNVWRDNE